MPDEGALDAGLLRAGVYRCRRSIHRLLRQRERRVPGTDDGALWISRVRSPGRRRHRVEGTSAWARRPFVDDRSGRPGRSALEAGAGIYACAPEPDLLRSGSELGVLSHRSAARVHGIAVLGRRPVVDVTVVHRRRRAPAWAELHRARLGPSDAEVVDGLRVTSLERTSATSPGRCRCTRRSSRWTALHDKDSWRPVASRLWPPPHVDAGPRAGGDRGRGPCRRAVRSGPAGGGGRRVRVPRGSHRVPRGPPPRQRSPGLAAPGGSASPGRTWSTRPMPSSPPCPARWLAPSHDAMAHKAVTQERPGP